MLKEYIKNHTAEIMQTWNDLHAIPEWGFKEFKTSAYLQKQLEAHGIKCQQMTETGFIAELDSGKPGLTVGVRADIDALPYKNEAGETYYCHACGHDSHATMALWTMFAMKDLGLVKTGKLRGVFQPAEEIFGAPSMISAGAGKGLDEFYGVHIRPIQEIRYGKASPALVHGSYAIAEVTIQGTTAHGARPHLGYNAINAAAMIVMSVNSIWLNPAESWSVKVTRIHSGGDVVNIVPDKATLSLDLRAATNPLMDELRTKLQMAVENAAAAAGCTAQLNIGECVPGAEYSPECVEHLKEAIKDVLGEENVGAPIITPGGDDFHCYHMADKNLKTAFLALGADATPGLHNPQMTFNHDAMLSGVEILTTALAGRVK